MKRDAEKVRTKLRRGALLALLAAVGGTGLAARAGTVDWKSNAANSTWSSAGNWVANGPPSSSDDARFNQTSYTNQPNAGTTAVKGVIVGDGTTATAALTISGTNLSIGTNGITVNANAGATTISATTLTLGDGVVGVDETWTNNSGAALSISSAIKTVNGSDSVLTFGGSGSGGISVSGVINDSNGSHTISVTKTGTNSLTLSGVNIYTGDTTVNAGTLIADLSTNTTGVISDSSNLTLGGGTFTLKGKSTGSSTETIGNLTLTANTVNALVVNKNGGTSTTLTLGNSWSRGAGSTLNINISSGGILTSSPTLTNSVLGYAAVTDATSTGFATVSGGNVVRYTSATTLATSSNTATTNYKTATGTTNMTNASRSINSLSIDATATTTVDLGGASNVLTLTSGGLLMTGASNATIQNGQVGASGSELIVHQYGTGSLTISGTISSGAGRLTKAGPGALVLSGTSAYSGATNINGGSLITTVSNALPTGTALTITGATLKLNSPTISQQVSSLSLTGGSTIVVQLQNTGSSIGTINDTGAFTGSGQTLQVDLVGGLSNFTVGQSFQIFTGTKPGAGTFTSFNLPAGYLWDTSHLQGSGGSIDGSIRVAAIPEPGPMMLGLAGLLPLGFMCMRRKRAR